MPSKTVNPESRRFKLKATFSIKSRAKKAVAEEKKPEFWRWTEANWKDPDMNWQTAQFITVGIDVGSVSSQAVIMADGRLFAYGNMRTGSDSPNSARNAYKYALGAVGDMPENRMNFCIGTGYGRINVPFANRTATEIACHARGANFIYGPEVRTVLDVGGQDIKAIHCDEKGKVINFLMNDKCAAGTGRGMEVFCDLLGVAITEVGDRSFELPAEEPPAVSSTCVVYAKSEATGLLRKGWTKEEVLAAYCNAMAERIFSLVERIGVKPGFAVTGGMAKNRGVVDRLMKKIGIERMPTQWDTQIAGAAGAALFAYALCLRGDRKSASK
jgi:bzd-type benzoyl-CoA reductase Q subunit